MLRIAIRWGIVTAALVALFMSTCVDINSANNCLDLGSCPDPDAGDGGDAADGGHD